MIPFDGSFALNYAHPLALAAYNDPWNTAAAGTPAPPPCTLLSTFTDVAEIMVGSSAAASLALVAPDAPAAASQRLLEAMLRPKGAGHIPGTAAIARAEGFNAGIADVTAPVPGPSPSGPSPSGPSPSSPSQCSTAQPGLAPPVTPHTLAPHNVPVDQRFGWVCVDPAAQRLIVLFRGTQAAGDWLNDIDFLAEPYKPIPHGGIVHAGFQHVYYSVRDSLLSLVNARLSGAKQLLVVGHSLGAALATLALPDLLATAAAAGVHLTPLIYNLASPRVGFADFEAFFNKQSPAWRVANLWDVVPHIPPVLSGYIHVGEQLTIDSGFSLDVAHNHRLPTGYLPGLQSWATKHPAGLVANICQPSQREVPPGISN